MSLEQELSLYGNKITTRIEILIILSLSIVVFIVSSHYDLLEYIVGISYEYEYLKIDNIVSVFVFLVFALMISAIRRGSLFLKAKRDLSVKNQQLLEALAEVKQIKGIIPICSYCHQIRDDKESWHQLEAYFTHHTDANFSHSICPDCFKREMTNVKQLKLDL